MSLHITEQQISKWPPDAQAVVRFLLATIAEIEKRLEPFDGPKTPQNSSPPPSGALADQPQVFMDESPTKERPARAWLWSAVARTFAVFSEHAGMIARRTFCRRMGPVRHAVDGLVLRGTYSGNARLVGMCTELYDHRNWLWAFVDQDNIQPTNNTAERALRDAVIGRTLCFGTESDR